MANNDIAEERMSIDEIRQVFEKIVQIQKKLAAERKALGLTQKDVAKKLGWKQSEVSRFESSETLPRIDTVMIYARCLGYDLDLVSLFEKKMLSEKNELVRFDGFLVQGVIRERRDGATVEFTVVEEPSHPISHCSKKESHHERA